MATPEPQDPKAEPVQPSKLGAALLTASEGAVAMMCFLVCMSIIERDVRTLMIVGAAGLISGACSRAIVELVAKIQSADRRGAKRAEERTARENWQAAGTSGLSSAMGSLVPLLGAAFIKDHQLRLVVVMVVSTIALVGLVALGAKLNNSPPVKSASMVLLGGYFAIGVAYCTTKLIE